jgi:hypothetical protein
MSPSVIYSRQASTSITTKRGGAMVEKVRMSHKQKENENESEHLFW